MKSRVCFHGHFYQPPREDPWTGKVERQPSAGEDHDWNVRVTRECYAPNAAARVLGANGDVVALVNNYEYLSFDFGPTLLSWLEQSDPATYAAVIAADAAGSLSRKGHGNAVAQVYNHVIMPLANERDQRTQIIWGEADFTARFGRRPEAMWLAETACDDGVLDLLCEYGMKYVILAPGQAQRVRDDKPGAVWRDVSDGSIDASEPYVWRSPSGRRLAIFFYDGFLSNETGFGELMSDAASCADVIAARAEDFLVICTDGETYGHHKKFADMALARLFSTELDKRSIESSNFGLILEQKPPRRLVEIKKGPQRLGTSWSCAHGVGRWMEDCGCGTAPGGGAWRAPLREAFDWLRDELAILTEKGGNILFKDVWAARDAYIGVLLDRRGQAGRRRSFLRKQMRASWPSAGESGKALAIMELQKFAMFMYTSCGWFFSDVSGIEAAQNLKYAARAVQLGREVFGVDLEPELLERLRCARGSDKILSDAALVYRECVRPSAGKV